MVWTRPSSPGHSVFLRRTSGSCVAAGKPRRVAERDIQGMRIPGAADGLVRRQVRNMDTRDEYECRLAERDLEIAKRDAEIAERSAEVTQQDGERTKRDTEIAERNQRDLEIARGLLEDGVPAAIVKVRFGLSAADLRELRRRRKTPPRRGTRRSRNADSRRGGRSGEKAGQEHGHT